MPKKKARALSSGVTSTGMRPRQEQKKREVKADGGGAGQPAVQLRGEGERETRCVSLKHTALGEAVEAKPQEEI